MRRTGGGWAPAEQLSTDSCDDDAEVVEFAGPPSSFLGAEMDRNKSSESRLKFFQRRAEEREAKEAASGKKKRVPRTKTEALH